MRDEYAAEGTAQADAPRRAHRRLCPVPGFILFRAISKELARRRRMREEQLAREQQRMREAALRAAEEEGIEVELSLEEKARLELQENAINLARERPDDVARSFYGPGWRKNRWPCCETAFI